MQYVIRKALPSLAFTRTPTPSIAVGACWAEPAESVPVTRADAPCGKDMFEQGMSLEQNLMRMTA